MLFVVMRPGCDPTKCKNIDIFADYFIGRYGKSDTTIDEENFRFESKFQEIIVISDYSADVSLLFV